MTTVCSVLVTDGDQRAALAVTRSLGRAGYRVVVASPTPRSLAGASRYATFEAVTADALQSSEQFAADIEALARYHRPDVVLPITEASLLAILPVRERFASVIPFASLSQFRRICNKAQVLETAERIGMRVPRQVILESPTDAAAFEWTRRYPVAIKSSRSVVDSLGVDGRRAKTGVTYAADAASLRASLSSAEAWQYPLLVQERVRGDGFALSVLVWDGALQAAFAHRRLREKPPSGGVSVLRESIPINSMLLAASLELLREFEWRGVAMVEFKCDEKSGTPYLMEINGRFWGSLQLAIDAGVDFPRLLVECALGRRPVPVCNYREGVMTRWELGDVDQLLTRLRHSPSSLSLSPAFPGRLSAVAEFVGTFFSKANAEVFHWSDPRPFAREAAQWFRGG